MKKIILVLLLLTLCLTVFASCTNDNGETPGTPAGADNNAGGRAVNTPPGDVIMQDWYFFRSYDGSRLISGHNNPLCSRGPVKINPLTQTVTDICLDPLCDHGEECPLFNSANFHVACNYLFFTKRKSNFIEMQQEWLTSFDLCVYDMKNRTVRKLAEYWGPLSIWEGTGSYLYYSVSIIHEEDDDYLADYFFYRADAKTGEIIEIPLYGDFSGQAAGSNLVHPNISMIRGDTIYWYRLEEINENMVANANYYTTDLDGNNKTDIGSIPSGTYHNGYMYSNILTTPEHITTAEEFMRLSSLIRKNRQLYRIPFDSTGSEEPELIIGSFVNRIFLGGKIYFTKLEEEPELIEHNGEQAYNWSGGKVYVINTDGTDQRLLADTGHNLSDGGGIFEAKTIDGVDYIALSFVIVNDDPLWHGGNFRISSDTIIINASTGEWTVLSVPA